MKFTRFSDVRSVEGKVREMIARYGYRPDHSYAYFVNSEEEDSKPVYFENQNGHGLLTFMGNGEEYWTVLNPLAPKEHHAEMLSGFIEQMFDRKKTETVYVDIDSETRKPLLKLLPDGIKARRVTERMWWPVLQLSTYDPALPGPDLKSMRNVMNRFTREHESSMVDATSVSKEALHAIVEKWRKNRPARHRVYPAEYHALIDTNFEGTSGGVVLIVDGVPEGITAGWPVPNSKEFYHSLSLHTYAHWGLGEFLMLQTLSSMKREGYEYANLGGSDKALLSFKKKFGSVTTYTSDYFSIARL